MNLNQITARLVMFQLSHCVEVECELRSFRSELLSGSEPCHLGMPKSGHAPQIQQLKQSSRRHSVHCGVHWQKTKQENVLNIYTYKLNSVDAVATERSNATFFELNPMHAGVKG